MYFKLGSTECSFSMSYCEYIDLSDGVAGHWVSLKKNVCLCVFYDRTQWKMCVCVCVRVTVQG